MNSFALLRIEWHDLHEAAARAESLVYPDPRTSCFYARRALEIAVAWLYKHDHTLQLPYQDHLSALIHEPTFRARVGPAIFSKARVIKDLGNLAVHSNKPVRQYDALTATRELFHLCYWLARTYGKTRPPESLAFDANLLPKTSPVPQQTLDQLRMLEEQLRERDQKLTDALSSKATLDQELAKLRAEVAAARAANATIPDIHDYSEAETRDFFIDLLLREAGWPLDKPHDREYEVSGMRNNEEKGFVDYVLWGDDGKPLGLVEAKRTKRDPRVGQQQAKLYADCLEKQFGQRPIIFYSSGYEHWIWDDSSYPPREIQGFYKKDELELLIQRRSTRKPLAEASIDGEIVERYYQKRAIRRITEAFEWQQQRKALVVMATGAGKTRAVIALCDLLMRCNWAKRVLFLADRVALVKQAVNAFKAHLPASSPVNLVSEKNDQGRVYVSTYPTMMGLIDEAKNGQRRFGAGHFDLVIIDEAHRSVYQKYRAIFEYFDSYLVGLTATPRDEIDRNTYALFDLEKGVPTDAYELDEAVEDKFLVPPKAVSVPLRFQRHGITYDELPDDEKEQWDALEWNDQGTIPDRVEAAALNQWLFNSDTVDKVLEHLMTRGQKVAGGDRPGKTIIFAANNDHAEFIAQRFNIAYPHYKGEFARVITYKTEYAQSLIDDFSDPDKAPHIAISVDMLDTGIDIPEIVNLAFFKLVRSKTKFWQMVGRGTRLRPNLFGPDDHKEFFYLFDYCQNLEFFNQKLPETGGASAESLSSRLFSKRVKLISVLDTRRGDNAPQTPMEGTQDATKAAAEERELRGETSSLLRRQVEGMNIDNFVVRPHRRLVERFSKEDAWNALDDDAVHQLTTEVAHLPSSITDNDEEAKRFDLLMLRLQLATLSAEPEFDRWKAQVRTIVTLLLDQGNIPAVRQQMDLIDAVAGEDWWHDVTVGMLENARKRLRSLIKLIEKAKKKPVYTNFQDQRGDETPIDLPITPPGINMERFRAKAREFLNHHENHITIAKVRRNVPLTESDLSELERMLLESGAGSLQELTKAKEASKGLALFVRSLVGLDREAAKAAMSEFLTPTATANQIEFINMIVDYLTENGAMEPGLLYESPFTDHSPHGPEGLFSPVQIDRLVQVLRELQGSAAA
jgi:type I restriction enzyme R subunit